ncbi:MAG TPA: response regulator, partial [Bacteroidetes bacterium]|nr:response regulator [Bacteroidota bacterium]
MRILVVDDEPEVCDALVGFLADEGHEAHAVQTGEDGLRFARESVYDVVFLDVRLPGMGGLEVLQRLRQDVPGTDVVMISG